VVKDLENIDGAYVFDKCNNNDDVGHVRSGGTRSFSRSKVLRGRSDEMISNGGQVSVVAPSGL